MLATAYDNTERVIAANLLGNALLSLGSRDAQTVRLEEAIVAYRAGLAVSTRERMPLQWAATQSNLGAALSILGAREAGAARLESRSLPIVKR